MHLGHRYALLAGGDRVREDSTALCLCAMWCLDSGDARESCESGPFRSLVGVCLVFADLALARPTRGEGGRRIGEAWAAARARAERRARGSPVHVSRLQPSIQVSQVAGGCRNFVFSTTCAPASLFLPS